MKLVEDLVLSLLNEESGYMEQVAGWNLACALSGAILADLALQYRIDMDMESLTLLDAKPTGDSLLDPVLADIATAEGGPHTVQYWVEKKAPDSDGLLEKVLEELTAKGILTRASGGFWSLSQKVLSASKQPAREATRQRIIQILMTDEIPAPREAILIGLINASDAFHFLFPPEEYKAARERIKFISNMDLVGRAVCDAAIQSQLQFSLASQATKPIPRLKLRSLLTKQSFRQGNSARIFADLYQEYGPVFELRMPVGKPLVAMAGNAVNMWVNRRGRLHLITKNYISGLEQVFGAQRTLPGMDGAEHFRMRKAQRSAMSRSRLWERIDELYGAVRGALREWKPGDTFESLAVLRRLMTVQTSQLSVGVDASHYMEELLEFKDLALLTHVQRVFPKFMLKTPRMRRIRKKIDQIVVEIKTAHTVAQRSGKPRDLADNLFSLHNTDPQFFPQKDMTFALTMPLITAIYMANGLSFMLYNLVTRPDIYRRVQSEADALFANGDPQPGQYSQQAIDVTYRFIMETLRLYPAVPLQLRDVINNCVVEGYEIPVGTRVLIASTAPHYLAENYPEPLRFDIDRHLPERAETEKPGAWGSFGLGTHTCLGKRWAEMQIAVNLLMIAHHFDLEVSPPGYRLQLNPFPTNAPRKKLKFRVRAVRHPVEG
ncbi:MAG: cytochrome P450 [Gammaproteobacteria bacterium]|nr:cytochrome P450 [Gammaproteobacteria bacterium]MCY4255877.1 cytochrome P450 [Gammaproteobacteria bacterium]MCY4340415.1 cytochrome P450 [Gammaproteobacteria bacterium]